MASITLSTGREEIEIVRDGKSVGNIYFSPADVAILTRLQEVRKKIKDITFAPGEDEDYAINEALRIDKEMRDLIDYAFDYPCSDVVFGPACTFSTVGGVSMLEQFLTASYGIISAAVEKETKEVQKHTEKYLKKYGKGK